MNCGEKLKQDRWLRDLCWAIESPYLMKPVLSEEGDSVTPINIEQIDERHIEAFIEKYSGHRVGYYFEHLIHYWLKHVRQVEILAQGFQIVEQGRTLGELDFVFRDEQGQINHWEVAAKFYLYYEDHKVMGSHYVGPNAQDTFELKREKIFGKQLPLSEKVFPEVNIRQAFVKGRIFYHPESGVPENLPQGMRADHLRAVWIRYAELAWLEGEEGDAPTAYRLIEKPYWLASECLSVFDSPLLSLQDLNTYLTDHFSDSEQPILISVLLKDESLWSERERVFVVADDWPGRAS